jgi:TetR/AcrR family transcriptional repressor of bet genes
MIATRIDTKSRSKSKRRTAPKEVRRLQLIEATVDCIAERGISGTTMAAVTGRAGLSMGIVSLHFESKDNLLNATLTHLSQEVRSTWAGLMKDDMLAPAERLWAVAMSSFDTRIFNPTKISVWFAYFGEAQYRVLYRKIVESFDDERTDVLAGLCENLSVDNTGDPIDVASIAGAIESFGDGLWLNAILYPENFTRDYCISQMATFLRATFPAHFKKPSLGVSS